uniref:Uncharacterized protein n=1 Tax=Peronospora matthiolae TaxID=2874970 RepID=A0AAV1U5Z7_9STRA
MVTPARPDLPAETVMIKIKKFTIESRSKWLRWTNQLCNLAQKKQWTHDQKAHN